MAEVDSENLYPNDGEYFSPAAPALQQKNAKQQQDDTLEELPLIKAVLKHLDERIAFYDTLDSIQVDIETDAQIFQKIHAAHKLCRDALKTERNFILARVASVKK
jgi:hypothetical protein